MINKMKRWTQQDDVKLTELLLSGKYRTKQIASIMGRTISSIKYRAFTIGVCNKTMNWKYSCDASFWSVMSPLNCYWAGFSLADASLCKLSEKTLNFSIGLSSKDKGHLEQFKKDVKFTGIIREVQAPASYDKSKTFGNVSLRITTPYWENDLKNNFSLVPNKTKNLNPPNFNDEFLEFCLLIGFLDGDGCLCLTTGRGKPVFTISVASSSEKMINWVKAIIDKKFPNSEYSRGKRFPEVVLYPNGKWFSFGLSGLRCMVLFDYLRRFPVPKLERKWNKPGVLELLKWHKQEFPEYFDQTPIIEAKILAMKESDINAPLAVFSQYPASYSTDLSQPHLESYGSSHEPEIA